MRATQKVCCVSHHTPSPKRSIKQIDIYREMLTSVVNKITVSNFGVITMLYEMSFQYSMNIITMEFVMCNTRSLKYSSWLMTKEWNFPLACVDV